MTTMRIKRPETTLLVSFLVLTQAGCSLLVDGDRYLGGGVDAGPTDAGPRDAAVPPEDGAVPVDGGPSNRAPVLGAVGLTSYDPVVGATLRAVPGPASDPDGDRVTLRYQWFRNDVAIEGAGSSVLTTATFAADDRFRVEAWAFDGALESPRVTAGPVRLAPDVTRWRPLMPNDFSELSYVFYDEPNRRHVRVGSRVLWEYAVDNAGALRIAPITIQGTGPSAPDSELVAYHDPGGRRVFVFELNGSASSAFVLDLSARGAESWSMLELAGEPPTLRFASSVWYDAATRRIYGYGGLNERATPPVGNELWALDASAGEERWEPVLAGGSVVLPNAWGATMTADPTRESAVILAGGVSFDGDRPTLSTDMYRVTLEEGGTANVELLGAVLPSSAFGLASATDEASGRVIFAGGVSDIEFAVPFGVVIFDPTDESFVRPASADVGVGLLGSLHRDPDDSGRFLMYGGLTNDASTGSGFELRAIDASTGDATPIVSERRPPSLSEGSMSFRGGPTATLLGGRLSEGTPSGAVYAFDLATATWTEREIMPDAVEGTSPTPRFGNMSFDSSRRTGLQLWSGETSAGEADTEVWELLGSRWLHRTLRMGPAPTARRGAAFIGAGTCGAEQNYVFGGESLAGVLLGDAQTLVCDEGDRKRGCFWELSADGGTAPSPRAWATLGVDDGATAWLVGGWTGSASSPEVFTFDACSGGPSPWTRATLTTRDLPPPRFGHSMLFDSPTTGELSSFLVFGGSQDLFDGASQNDVWRLEVLGPTSARWVEIVPEGSLRPQPRTYHQAIWDEAGSRMIVFGGRDPYRTLGDAWELVVRR
jgi:hypothetical protein